MNLSRLPRTPLPPYRAGKPSMRNRRRGFALSLSLGALVSLFALPAAAQPTPAEDESRAAPSEEGRTAPTPPTGAASPTAPGAIGTAEETEPPAVAPEGKAQAPKPTPTPGGAESPKRALPDYDGRGPEPTTAGDVALWVPRVLLAPAYLVSEFLVRRPLGWLITTAERNQLPSVIANFFTFGPDKKAGVVPTAFLDFGFRASFGIYAFWDDLLGKDNHLRLHASTLGKDWLQGALADKIPLGPDAFVDLRLEGIHRPDQIFHGLGPRSRQEDRVRYGIDVLQAHGVFESFWWRGSRVTFDAGVKDVGYRNDACCDDASLTVRIAEGRATAPPAFYSGHTTLFQRGEITIDTRNPRPESQTGFRAELDIEQGSNVRESKSNWVKYGGSVGAFVDLKNNRVVSLSATTLFVDPISSGAVIPFTEQVVLGGQGPMRGYLYGRLVDRSAAIATLKYRWPIWVFLDGTMHAALGNVFGPQLENFKTKLLRLSTAIGVESVGGADHTFEILAGFGTETFEDGLKVNSFRLLFGTNRGF